METETDFIFVKEGEISHSLVTAKVKLVAEKMREVVADKHARLAIVRRQKLTWREDNPSEQMNVDVIIDMIKRYDTSKGWESLKEELFRCGGAGLTGEEKPTEAIRLLKKARIEGVDLEN